jgi:hypothetical protein
MSDDLVMIAMFGFLKFRAPSPVGCFPVLPDSTAALSSRVSGGVQYPRSKISTAPLRKHENWKNTLKKGGRTLYKHTVSIFAWTG